MPRIARICAVDHPHHVTQRGNNRERVFFKDEDRNFYLQILSQYSKKWVFDIWAYCLMSNHVHILVVPRREESLAKGIGSTNLVYTQYINRKYKRSGRIWQNRFFSMTIEKESYLWAVVRYIERNPVRAGLLEKAEDYPWSSARAHLLREKSEILPERSWLEESEMDAYRDFMKEGDQVLEESIRRATMTGRPLGSKRFVKRLEDILVRNDLISKRVGRPAKVKEEK